MYVGFFSVSPWFSLFMTENLDLILTCASCLSAAALSHPWLCVILQAEPHGHGRVGSFVYLGNRGVLISD